MKQYKAWKLKDGIDFNFAIRNYLLDDESAIFSYGHKIGQIVGQLDTESKGIFRELLKNESMFGIWLAKNNLIDLELMTKEDMKEYKDGPKQQTQTEGYIFREDGALFFFVLILDKR